MISLPFGTNKVTPSAQRVKDRAKEVGSGIPDILAPSAYREVEPSQELLEAAEPMYTEMSKGRMHQQTENGEGNGNGDAGTLDRASAEKIAADEDREFLELDI
jgi:hypothetical protein